MAEQAEVPVRNSLYDTDFVEWTQQQAVLLGEHRWRDLDLENLIDEVRSLGGSNKREIENRLVVLIAHLLKWKFQPGRRSPGWAGTIRGQRRQIRSVIQHSPSLRRYPAEVFGDQYGGARLQAAEDTGIDLTLFPAECPFTVDQALRDGYLPKEPDLYDQTED